MKNPNENLMVLDTFVLLHNPKSFLVYRDDNNLNEVG
jgi:predicted ribonuclease YlaK